MTDLLDAPGLAELREVAASHALLAFDFDGTLAPIVRNSDEAAMRPRTRRLLARIALRFPCAIISGRRVADLRARFDGIPIRWFIGNHGAEGVVPFPGASARRQTVSGWRESLQDGLGSREGVWIEDKGFSLSVHYRNAPRRTAARDAILESARRLPGVRIVPGKCVLNLVLETAPNKGTALAHLVGLLEPERVLFAGDDDTDEDAFAVDLGVPTTTIRVGGTGPSRARFRLEGQDAMDRLLQVLLDAKTGVTEEEE
ncbi:MAG TPA: trehalose-phosphatase [Anaeromyxobacteraceae bacterium]|nr:trehalose-phosphatase [Anaeromyxobacteraceae bacterium]